jgi:hypothetical protein
VAATLLAQAGGTYTSPNGNATTIQPDWRGMGVAGNIIDPLGNDQPLCITPFIRFSTVGVVA